jgi:hypothetical protein
MLLTGGSRNLSSGPFSRAPNNPVTPAGWDARHPHLTVNGEDIWLLYTVIDEELGVVRIFRSRVFADGTYEVPECLLLTRLGTGLRPVGMVWVDDMFLFVWQERIEGVIKAAWLDERWLDYYYTLDSAVKIQQMTDENNPVTTRREHILTRVLRNNTFANPPPPILMPYSGDAEKITLYGKQANDGTFRMMTEAAYRLTPGSFEVPPRNEYMPMVPPPVNAAPVTDTAGTPVEPEPVGVETPGFEGTAGTDDAMTTESIYE